MPDPAASLSWQVTGTTESRQFAADGTPVEGFTVFFQTGTGQQGTVFVPRNQFTVAAVRAAIMPAAALLDEVSALTSGT